MPPPSLSTTTMRRSASRAASAVSAPASWTNAMSPMSDDRRPRRRGRSRAPSTSRRRSRWRHGWRGPGPWCRRTTRGRAPASTTPRRARRRRGGGGRPCGRPPARSAAPRARARRRSPLRPRSAASRPAVAATPVAGRARQRVDQSRQRPPASRWATTLWSGSTTPGPPTWTTGAPDASTHWASTLDAAGRPMRTTTSGRSSAAQPLVAQHGVGGGDGAGERRAGPTSGRRARGQPVAASERRHGVGRRRCLRHRPGSTPRSWRRRSTTSVATAVTAGRAALVAIVRRVGSGRRHADERFAERQVEVHGPVGAAANARAPSDRHVDRRGGVGHAGIVEPAHRPAVQVGLVDRLRRADVAQLRRPVGGDDEHRDLRQPGLDDRRVEVGRRRAARAQQDRRRPAEARARARRTPPPARRGRRAPPGRGRSARASAIGVLREPGRHDGVAHAVGHELVDERGAERRLDVGRCHAADDTDPEPPDPRPTESLRRIPWRPVAIGWEHARRGLVRRRLSVVLHRQAAVRRRRSTRLADDPDVRRRHRGRLPAVPARPQGASGHDDAGQRDVRPQVRRTRAGGRDHRQHHRRGRRRGPRVPPRPGPAGQHP